jgi:hypothetical protein
MAVPYFYVDATHKVYFNNGFLLPVEGPEYERRQSIGRTENGKIKVYDHAWSGTYKRHWKVKAYFDGSESSTYYRLSDLITFIITTVTFSKTKFTLYDSAGSSYTVRLMNTSVLVSTIEYGLYEVNMTLEEDY